MSTLNPLALVDYHMHSTLSIDGCDPTEALALAAVRVGLREIGISEHLDTDPDDEGFGNYDESAVDLALERAREASGGQLTIRKGVEVCYQPLFHEAAGRLVAECQQIDYVIGSIHYLDRRHPEPASFEGETYRETYRLYMAASMQLVESGFFDVLGHFEYVRFHDSRDGASYDPHEYADEIETILQEMISREMVLELNVGGLRRPGGHTYPCRWTLQRYRELGGEAVCIGSDAHRAADVGAGIGRGLALLQEVGFRYVVTFKDRRRRWVNIDRFMR